MQLRKPALNRVKLVPGIRADSSPAQAKSDVDHPSHDGFARGPLQELLRARVLQDRKSFPPALKVLLWVAASMTALAISLAGILAFVDPRTFAIIGQMMPLSFAVGREVAILNAYGQDPVNGYLWVTLASILADLIALSLALPLFWLGIERLRAAPLMGGIILSIEKTAVEKREFLRRGGLAGLVAFVWLPGLGAGVTLAAAIGLAAKIPLRRLIIALALGSASVNAFWGIALFYTAQMIPRVGPWSYLPLALVVLLTVLAITFGLLQRRKRHLFPLVKVKDFSQVHISRLLEVGLTDGNDLLYANRRILAANLGIDPSSLARLRSVAEISMLKTVSPRHAEMLTKVGIFSIRDLAVAPCEMVAAAIHELELLHEEQPAPEDVEDFNWLSARWTREACSFFAESQIVLRA